MKIPLSAVVFLVFLTPFSVLAQPPNSTPAVLEFSTQASCGGDDCGQCGQCDDDVCTKKVLIYGVTARANQMHDKLVTAVLKPIQFTSQVYQTGCQNLTYEWTFGDGSTSDASDPIHDYTQPGNYEVKLKVRCDGACDVKEDKVEKVVIARADIDIDKVLESKEESPGDLVVRKHDNNRAPRRKVIIHRVEPADFNERLILGRRNMRLRLFTAPVDGDELMGDGEYEVALLNERIPEEGVELWVEGYRRSDSMEDAGLYLKAPDSPEVRDDVRFTVLWVDKPAVRLTGEVSADNDAGADYPSWTVANTNKLGPQEFNPTMGERIGWGLEVRASVHPRNFSPPGSLRLGRDLEYVDYEASTPFDSQDFKDLNDIPPGNDDDEEDDLDTLQDRDPNPKGFIYSLDAPGLNNSFTKPAGTIRRTRNNFRVFAWILIDDKPVRCSEIKEFFIRFSMIQTDAPQGRNWVVLRPPDVRDDLQASGGSTKLTWNLE